MAKVPHAIAMQAISVLVLSPMLVVRELVKAGISHESLTLGSAEARSVKHRRRP